MSELYYTKFTIFDLKKKLKNDIALWNVITAGMQMMPSQHSA